MTSAADVVVIGAGLRPGRDPRAAGPRLQPVLLEAGPESARSLLAPRRGRLGRSAADLDAEICASAPVSEDLHAREVYTDFDDPASAFTCHACG
jgi:hypothetical protein